MDESGNTSTTRIFNKHSDLIDAIQKKQIIVAYCLIDELLIENADFTMLVSECKDILKLVSCVQQADIKEFIETFNPFNDVIVDFNIHYDNHSQYNIYYDMMESKHAELKKLIVQYNKLHDIVSSKLSDYNDVKKKKLDEDTEYIQQKEQLRKLLQDALIKECELQSYEKKQIERFEHQQSLLQNKQYKYETEYNELKEQQCELAHKQGLFDIERNNFLTQKQEFYDETISINDQIRQKEIALEKRSNELDDRQKQLNKYELELKQTDMPRQVHTPQMNKQQSLHILDKQIEHDHINNYYVLFNNKPEPTRTCFNGACGKCIIM